MGYEYFGLGGGSNRSMMKPSKQVTREMKDILVLEERFRWNSHQ